MEGPFMLVRMSEDFDFRGGFERLTSLEPFSAV